MLHIWKWTQICLVTNKDEQFCPPLIFGNKNIAAISRLQLVQAEINSWSFFFAVYPSDCIGSRYTTPSIFTFPQVVCQSFTILSFSQLSIYSQILYSTIPSQFWSKVKNCASVLQLWPVEETALPLFPEISNYSSMLMLMLILIHFFMIIIITILVLLITVTCWFPHSDILPVLPKRMSWSLLKPPEHHSCLM